MPQARRSSWVLQTAAVVSVTPHAPLSRRRSLWPPDVAGLTVVLILALALMSPSALTWYLYQYHGAELRMHAPNFHVFIILVAIGFSAVVSFMTWRSYQRSGKRFEKWLLLGLLSFTIIYAPHGFLTNVAADNIWLFILYGPASRMVMGACFLIAVLQYGRPAVPTAKQPRLLPAWVAACVAFSVLIAVVALSPIAGERYVRWSMEFTAIGLFIGAIGALVIRGMHSHMMITFGCALALFCQSSFAFLHAPAWTHSWWYAHLIFAGGFSLLSFQVARVYRSTATFEDIFSQEELLDRLRVANENYRRSNEHLSNFAHLVSHDLQAPLRRVSSFVDVLVEGLNPESAQEHEYCIRVIQSNTAQMRALITGILELSTVDRSELEQKTVDLNDVVDDVFELFSGDFETTGSTRNRENLPVVQGDPALLFQVFQNLIQNALKYRAPERPLHVDVRASADGNFWRIDVTDNGMGFDPAKKDTVFQMLGRLHGENISGTGAGLAICRRIAERHGGRIDVVAQPDRGASFQVFLPRQKTPPRTA